jgi:hypothetical protein
MDANAKMIEELYEKTEQFSKTSIELIKLKTVDKSSDVISSLAWKLIVILLIVFLVVNLNIGIALWIGDLLHKTYYGFLILAAFYLLAGIVFYLFRNSWIKKPLRNSVIEQFVPTEEKSQAMDSSVSLNLTISSLEKEQKIQGEQLKLDFMDAYESLKPANILKSTLKDLTTSAELRTNIITAGLSMAAGYLSTRILKGSNFKFLRRISALLIDYGVSNLLRHPDAIKAIISNLFQGVFWKKSSSKE